MNAKNLQLTVSTIIIIPVALVYGLFPSVVLPELFTIKIDSINLNNICRANMGLYLAIASLWIAGITNNSLWLAATIANLLFMGGLAIGRILSLLLDGRPSAYFVTGLFIELSMAAWALYNFKKYGQTSQS